MNPGDRWLAQVACSTGALGALLRRPEREQERLGYRHTVREIAQQPMTWRDTALRVMAYRAELLAMLRGAGPILLTGSGSSQFAAECAAPGIASELVRPVSAVPAGELFTHPERLLAGWKGFLLVSLARSGNSPETCAVVSSLLERRPLGRHLVLTCNRSGRLATGFADPRVRSLVLADETNDRSAVMTSSFTSMVLAARGLGALNAPERYCARVERLAGAATGLLLSANDSLSVASRGAHSSVLFLGSGARFGAARESARKMHDATGARIPAWAESYLSLRQGSMAALRRDTLVVAFLASDPPVRAFELELLRELWRARLGMARVLVGEGLPIAALSSTDVVCDWRETGARPIADDDAPVLDVLVGQLLALFRSLAEGVSPDAPSRCGMIPDQVGFMA